MLLSVFLCHSSGDKEAVQALYGRLVADGFDPWLDTEKLFPGTLWLPAIEAAVRKSHVVVVCLSRTSITKEGFVQREISQALDVCAEKPEGTLFLIPLRLEQCEVPDRLSRWQWVDLFEETGYDRLVASLRSRSGDLAARSSAPLVRPRPEAKADLFRSGPYRLILGGPADQQKRSFWRMIFLWITIGLSAATVAILFWPTAKSVILSRLPRSNSVQVQGEELAAIIKQLGSVEQVIGGFADDSTDTMVLLIKKRVIAAERSEEPLTLEDVAFVLRWASQLQPPPLGCYLDQPENGLTGNLRVRYSGGAENTHIGRVMCEADRLLKEYSLGKMSDGRPIETRIPGYLALSHAARNDGDLSHISATLWFISRPRIRVTPDVWLVEDTGLKVGIREQVWQDGRYVASSHPETPGMKFADFFSDNMRALSSEQPWLAAFQRIVQLEAWGTQLPAFREMTGRMKWVDVYASRVYPTAREFPQISVTIAPNLKLSGGISLVPSDVIRIRGETSLTNSLRQMIRDNISKMSVGDSLEIGSGVTGIVLSVHQRRER